MTTSTFNEETICKLYEKTIDIANYYDNIGDIEKTIKYSLILCEEDASDTVGLTKIIYWASHFKRYDIIIELLKIIRNRQQQIDKAREIFYRENNITLKHLLIKFYIDIIKKKEKENMMKDEKISDYLLTFYEKISTNDFYVLYDEYIKESSKLPTQTKFIL